MKKLMIAFAVAAMAVCANAAKCSWGTEYVCDAGGEELSTGTYWVLALGSSSISDVAVQEGGTLVYGAGASVYDSGSIADGVSGQITSLSAANNGDKYALIIWDGDKTSAGMYGVSDVAMIAGIVDAGEGVQPKDADDITFANGEDDISSFISANTAVQAVPEPTSGLLLLLGVAGLALRRRRA